MPPIAVVAVGAVVAGIAAGVTTGLVVAGIALALAPSVGGHLQKGLAPKDGE